MITHDLVHGLNLCDRVAILSRGKIVQEIAKGEVTGSEFLDIYAEQTGRKAGMANTVHG